MRRLLPLLCVAAFALPAAPGQAAGFQAGAATVSITPPAFSATADAQAFPTCPQAVYTGPRPFAFEEPYVDLNGNGHFDYGEPFCDANGNGRYDGIYTSGQVATLADRVLPGDGLDARAFAISDGTHTAVVVSVVAQGLFQNYTDRMIAAAKSSAPAGHSIDAMIVSADHNESSPDTIGIYGAPDSGQGFGLHSGIDDYYMDWLVGRVAQAADQAVANLRPASLWARQFPLPSDLSVHLSDNWPTTDNSVDKPTAIDPKVGILQARAPDGTPLFTVMSLAAHNQEVGHDYAPDALSADWPGYFERAIDALGQGPGVFLVGDNGSEEDPMTVPPITPCGQGCLAQTQATGQAFAQAIEAQAPLAQRLRPGTISYRRTDFCVPVENNLFKAALQAGLFGQRQGYVMVNGQCVPSAPSPTSTGPTAPGAPSDLLTSVSLLDVGPDLQLLANPGEAFPALMLGSPWGYEDVPAACQDRANPPVPTWDAHAEFRFQVGLANDMTGYEIPPWAFIGPAGAFAVSDPDCNTGSGSTDSAGHHHKLETEGVGPTESDTVASQLAALVAAAGVDPTARTIDGRFVLPDGTLSRRPQGAVAVLLADPGSTRLGLDTGTLVALPGVTGVGGRAPDATGSFIDYDGQDQPAADITTRGMAVRPGCGQPTQRLYLDVFPALTAPASLGAVTSGQGGTAAGSCAPNPNTVSAPTKGGSGSSRRCADRTRPTVRILTVRVRGRRLTVTGVAGDRGRCRPRVAAVALAVSRRAGRRCRFLAPSGRLGRSRSCARPLMLAAHGAKRWRLSLRERLGPGRYRVFARALDGAGNARRSRALRLVLRRAAPRRRSAPR